jgi:23S rRNA (adenine2503-C2)-methyltransferase
MSDTSTNHRFIVPMPGGLAVEAVYYDSGTLCVSCQAGCAVGCLFCASGSRGWLANLSAEGMLLQLTTARSLGCAPRRITVSGIGEPLRNYTEVERFMALCREAGLPVSLTTTGGPLDRLAEALVLEHNGLMLSVHAGTRATHRRLLPGAPDLDSLWEVIAGVWPHLSRRRRRKLGVNYLLLAGVNDSPEELEALVRRMEPFPEMTLHLLTLNAVAGSPFAAPAPEALLEIRDNLSTCLPNVRLANRWRRQVEGGCGTLFVRTLDTPSDLQRPLLPLL